MSRQVYYNRGHWLSICDVCGQRFDNVDMQKRWDGLMVCKKDWEPRQPQDFIRAKADIQSLPWTRPEITDYTYIINSNINAIAGQAIAGQAITGNNSGGDITPQGTFTL